MRIPITYSAAAALLAAATLGASGAFAQSSGTEGPYLRLEGGLALPAAPGGSISGVGPITTGVADGFLAGGAAGWKFGAWRAEISLEYNQLGITELRALNAPFSTLLTTGNQSNLAGMVNGYYDIATGTPFVPYLGGGLGATQLGLNHIATRPGGVPLTNGTVTEFAWQAIGGVQYLISDHWSAGIEYRYFKSDNGQFTSAGGATNNAGNAQHNFLASLTYHFGAPPPPSPPAPAAMPAPPPAAAKVFIVFFDWDKDAITPEGQQIIRQAADAYTAGVPVQLQVIGYTDRSGSPGYNQRLSERRANNVAKALAALGVPKNEMVVSGRGENDNRVPTAPGVREPQNRRVEIVSS